MDEQLLAGPRVHMNKNKSVLVQVMFEILRSIAWAPQAAGSSGPTIILTDSLCHASTQRNEPIRVERNNLHKSLIMLKAIHNSCELTVSTAVRDLVQIR